ncbi:unnamed protein product [Rangifer tarandus platyrhynchus]|uniref:Uncharacterized protein n=1 Tax=Rangifer tarandus platyrhynchus TaxID=3082113 RepID=A0ABN8XU28_RANTA|nr:unnamed protein product [Rangifer tarandus platyrhynchus]
MTHSTAAVPSPAARVVRLGEGEDVMPVRTELASTPGISVGTLMLSPIEPLQAQPPPLFAPRPLHAITNFCTVAAFTPRSTWPTLAKMKTTCSPQQLQPTSIPTVATVQLTGSPRL